MTQDVRLGGSVSGLLGTDHVLFGGHNFGAPLVAYSRRWSKPRRSGGQ